LHAIPIPVLEPGVLCIVGEKKLDWVECQRALVCVSAHGKHQRVESTDHCRLDVVAYPDGLRNSLLIGHPRDQYTYTWYSLVTGGRSTRILASVVSESTKKSAVSPALRTAESALIG